MNTQDRIEAEFAIIETKLKQLQLDWAEHLNWVKEEDKQIKQKYPSQLKENDVATPGAISNALVRLGAIDQFIAKRRAVISKRLPPTDHTPLQDQLREEMQRSRTIST